MPPIIFEPGNTRPEAAEPELPGKEAAESELPGKEVAESELLGKEAVGPSCQESSHGRAAMPPGRETEMWL